MCTADKLNHYTADFVLNPLLFLLVCVCLQADDDPIMGFHQSFILKNINDAWVCTNDMFRLAIHNFG